MSKSPAALVRRRLARAIDWRVDTAVKQALAAQRAEFVASIAAHEHDVREVIEGLGQERLRWINDQSKRFESLELRTEQFDAAVDRLRTSITSLSVSLTDEQRAQGELLERLAADVGKRSDGTHRTT